ncbi:AbiH family protein [Chryseobacterium aquaticum]|uniref:AbiH family protein n=1 Tax=Chryseobacterium aquaticum TaxID=452084 RepID=UPI002FC64066
MEEKIVILGNGFDLRHFLPTSYNHLISILCEIEKLPEDKESVSFSDLFDGVFKEKNEWFYNQINEYYRTENFIFNLEEIKSIQNRLLDNSWFQYFKSVDKNKIETWIDFETEIERILVATLQYFESFSKDEFFKKPTYTFLKSGAGYYIPYTDYNQFFKSKLQALLLNSFKLISSQRGYWRINENYILTLEDEIQYYKEKDFFNFIYQSLEEFVGIFNDYILNIINAFNGNLVEEKKEGFTNREGKYLFQQVKTIFSFNYTNTFDNFYGFKQRSESEQLKMIVDLHISKKESVKIEFLHGSYVENWKKDSDKLKIVLGVDDIHESLKKHKLFQFTKYFQKLHKQTDYLFLKDFEATNRTKNQNRYIFYFWGHSLDYSDRQYIREVFNLVANSDGSKIKIFYHSISAKGDQLKNLLGIIEKEIIEKFMKDKIIEFIESTSENLFEEL